MENINVKNLYINIAILDFFNILIKGNRKCCDGNCLPCEQTCNKLLSCKNHKCFSSCHAGSCYPCTVIAEIKCPCGESKTKVPCVKSKSNIQVTCKKECKYNSLSL